jgi:hypothetical protein
MQNEDGRPNLVIIDPKNGMRKIYTFGPTPHGGGYDDIAFRGDDVFLSASNPANNPNFAPAVVRAKIDGSAVNVTEAVNASAEATDIPTDTPTMLNLQDPDSMIFNPIGDLVLDSQADAELIVDASLGILRPERVPAGAHTEWRSRAGGRHDLRDFDLRHDSCVGSRCRGRGNCLCHYQGHFRSGRDVHGDTQFSGGS